MLRAMARAVAERGYEDVSVADVVEAAGVSRSTFYEEFASKEECLLAAYDALLERLVTQVFAAYETESRWPDQVRAGLEALLGALAEQPDVARMATVEIPAAGPEAHRRYREAIGRFVSFFLDGRKLSGRGERLPKETELMAVGGAEAIIFDEVVAGRAEGLRELLPDILFAVLVPYLGPDEAAKEMRRAAATG
jgi:AcrR family transcriptional regulator